MHVPFMYMFFRVYVLFIDYFTKLSKKKNLQVWSRSRIIKTLPSFSFWFLF